MNWAHWPVVYFAVLSFAFLGCFAAGRTDAPRPNVTGVWLGRSEASCGAFLHERGRCLAMQNITFSPIQDEQSTVSGYYKCSYGNSVCLNLNELGKVRYAKIDSGVLSMRVMMEDGSDCIFDGFSAG